MQYRVSFLVSGADLALLMGVLGQEGASIVLDKIEHLVGEDAKKRKVHRVPGLTAADCLLEGLGERGLSRKEMERFMKDKGYSKSSLSPTISILTKRGQAELDGKHLVRKKGD
jgi:hypothetical protein